MASCKLYPRSLYEWLKVDDKILKASIADGKTVFEAAEVLQREPVSVLRHLDQIEILPCTEHTEEWVEAMSLALAEVPLEFVISWCTAAADRLPYEMFASFATRELAPAFELARRLKIIVANADALDDLVWLAEQPNQVQDSYEQACMAIVDAFEVLTPLTLKNQVVGIKATALIRTWASTLPDQSAPARGRGHRQTGTRRRAAPTTARTIYARKSGSRYSKPRKNA
jgi:hypothetical protein